MQNIVKPRIMSGFMELMPREQVIFDNMKDTIKKVFTLNGFTPLDTPVLELSEVLLAKAGGETEKQIYRFTRGDTDMSLRFDLTVPLARYVAMHQADLNFPFKRFHIAKSYRGERSQKGRFREFYQCDADIIGENELSVVADAECISLIYKVYSQLNIDDIEIRISNRKILTGLMQMYNVNKTGEVLHVLDKFGKMSNEDIIKLIVDLGEPEKTATDIVNLLSCDVSKEQKLEMLEAMPNKNEVFMFGISELKQVFEALDNMGVPQKFYKLDTTIIRGLDYYTGTIFETKLLSHLEFGSIGGGGRYDNLAGNFTKNKLVGVGVSFGLTRLFDCLMKNDMLSNQKVHEPKVAIIPLGNTLKPCLELSNDIISNGVSCTVLYENKSFKSKLNYANKQEIPFVIIIGEDEVKNNSYVLKNMFEGTQQSLDKQTLIENLKKVN